MATFSIIALHPLLSDLIANKKEDESRKEKKMIHEGVLFVCLIHEKAKIERLFLGCLFDKRMGKDEGGLMSH